MQEQASGEQPGSDAPTGTSSLPPLFLHIGRGKSGSSAIQGLAHDYVDFMKAMGIACPLTAQGEVNHARLAAALQSGDDPETIEKFRKDVRRNKRRKVFVSAEALFSLPKKGIRQLKRNARSRDIRLIGYIRDYPSWLQSVYAQETKRAKHFGDFDTYYKKVRPSVSALPRLERWAEMFGWEAMHVRPLLSETLVGGNLITDVLHALGVNAIAPDVQTRNVAPHWMSLELQRALAEAAKAKSVAFELSAARVTHKLFEKYTDSVRPRHVQYLTKDQWLDLAELYRADMSALGRHLGQSFPINLPDPTERPFPPDVSRVTPKVKADILKGLNSARYQARLAPDLIELLREILNRKTAD